MTIIKIFFKDSTEFHDLVSPEDRARITETVDTYIKFFNGLFGTLHSNNNNDDDGINIAEGPVDGCIRSFDEMARNFSHVGTQLSQEIFLSASMDVNRQKEPVILTINISGTPNTSLN
ncbi:MAG: hypothetical protein KA155_05530 [Alphaproteobacteria bacterium]|jgi:hypothetical protein|nr:hypothetical protein [Alphaproteobacteria bacterium]